MNAAWSFLAVLTCGLLAGCYLAEWVNERVVRKQDAAFYIRTHQVSDTSIGKLMPVLMPATMIATSVHAVLAHFAPLALVGLVGAGMNLAATAGVNLRINKRVNGWNAAE